MGLGGEAFYIKQTLRSPDGGTGGPRRKHRASPGEILLTSIFLQAVVTLPVCALTGICLNKIFDIQYNDVFRLGWCPCDQGILITCAITVQFLVLYLMLTDYDRRWWPVIAVPVTVILMGIIIITSSGYWDNQMSMYDRYASQMNKIENEAESGSSGMFPNYKVMNPDLYNYYESEMENVEKAYREWENENYTPEPYDGVLRGR